MTAPSFARLAPRAPFVTVVAAALIAGATSARADKLVDFDTEVAPMLRTYCMDCHGPTQAKGGVTFSDFTTEQSWKDQPDMLETVLHVFEEGDMPPKREPKQPTSAERAQLLAWLKGTIKSVQAAAPNDPGLVGMPRLNHREYARVVRDLTGREMNLGGTLVQDSSAGEGFLNVGQAQTMQVGQFEGFFAAARRVADHLIATPDSGWYWSEAPRDLGDSPAKEHAQLRLAYKERLDVLFAEQHRRHFATLKQKTGLQLGAYLEGAWRYQHRAALGKPNATLADIARESDPQLFPTVLMRWWELLQGEDSAEPRAREWVKGSIFMQRLAAQWRALPAPSETTPEKLRAALKQIEKYRAERISPSQFVHDYGPLEIAPGDGYFSEPRQRQKGENAKGLQRFHIDLTKSKTGRIALLAFDGSDGNDDDYLIWQNGEVLFTDGTKRPWHEVFPSAKDRDGKPLAWGTHPFNDPLPSGAIGIQAPQALVFDIPAGAKQLWCEVVMDPKRGMNSSTLNAANDRVPDDLHWIDKRRILGNTFGNGHSSPRALSLEIAMVHLRTSADVVYAPLSNPGEQSEKPNPRARAEQEMRDRHAFYWATPDEARLLGLPVSATPSSEFVTTAFMRIPPTDFLPLLTDEQRAELAGWRTRLLDSAAPTDRARERAAAAKQLAHFLPRAWRGDVKPEAIERLLKFYDTERASGAGYTVALRAALVPALMHPRFVYRFSEARGEQIADLDGKSLATRMAFVLWASAPDEELLAGGRSGKLKDPAFLRDKVPRMLADPRARGFAEDFAGFWLQFADFSDNAAPDPERFPTFTPTLKQAIETEPILFFQELFKNNEPITEALTARYTFLNEELAKHYGVPGVTGADMRKVALEDPRRGGILGMANFLIKYSAPLRTSPVKRGTWLYENVLGFHMPTPPNDIPMLSDEERNDAGESVRLQLERHRADPSCSACHDKIDPLGIALENFDPIGRWREKDGAGEPVDSNGRYLFNDRVIAGITGLREHLSGQSERFVAQFTRKLTGYALGRAVGLTDKPLLDQMARDLADNQNRPVAALVTLFTSPQFTQRREYFTASDDAPVVAATSTANP